MFNLTRYYSIASLVCIIIAAAVLGMFYRHESVNSLIKMAEDRNAALTRVFGNALWPHFSPLLKQPADRKMINPASPQIASLRRQVVALMKDTATAKVKVYNMDGLTVFSTEAKQIGESKADNAGFLSAALGEQAFELTHRNQFSAFDREIESRDLLSSYIPFVPEDSKQIEGVVELYSDITPFLAEVKRTQWLVVLVVVGVLSLLYSLLYLVVRRANLIIKEQEAKLASSLARIEEDNQLLDQRVNERTLELQELNRTLQGEIAERERAEEGLRLSAKVFENTVEGVIITDAETKILAVNRAFSQVTGYGIEDVLNLTPQILKSGRHEPEFYEDMWKSLKQSGQWVGEIWNKRKTGEIYPERLTIGVVRDTTGEVGHYVGVFSDISDVKRTQERLDFLAHHDLLTCLPNRLLFNQRLKQSLALAQRNNRQLAVVFIDLDHFKNVNDTLGHDLGDELLKRVAEELSEHVRTSDTLARIGGDEFILLLDEIEAPRYAGAIAEKFLELLSHSMMISGYEIVISASIGVSFYPSDGQDAATLVKNADTAMYYAKTHGRNSSHFYAPAMSEYARERVHLEALLRRSIERNELLLHYQPQVDIRTGKLLGAEALVRWNSPELGIVMPVRFIPVAEDIGFISALGEWVLRTACHQVKEWDESGFVLPTISVNLSMKQLEHGDIISTVFSILEETGLSAERLEMEVTESTVMDNERVLRVLEGLRALGIQLAVDDFGTGYSSLSYLSRLPIQKLKIDRSFISNVTNDSSREAIVRAIIALANALNLQTIAEGIETESEAKFLRQEGCQQAQGYLFSRPLPPDQVLARWLDV
ncbi:putative bifunctional diguanylate cyclase/phosphodiesterase [Pelotalea chapellei]|uniref:EAL domain-containing protein n=1 Tax=Pelotalea chapellei TaxID=44671 RepID=A0ABS5UD51_9BACT|nr:EAL domain-containing protein [Pelotalea chapellei]MBT1073558.1 EAL domain-containing protein [Pelotalea chapellei]